MGTRGNRRPGNTYGAGEDLVRTAYLRLTGRKNQGACSKIPFQSRAEANSHARSANKNGASLKCAYKCIDCEAWHLTSMTKRESRATNKKKVAEKNWVNKILDRI